MSRGESIATKLAAQVERQLEINAKLGAALLKDLESVEKVGRPIITAEGECVGTSYVPDRDWARCYGHYRGTTKDLLTEQREGIKLKHALQATGETLTDEQYQQELLDLGKDALRTLTAEEVTQVLAERGLKVESLVERE